MLKCWWMHHNSFSTPTLLLLHSTFSFLYSYSCSHFLLLYNTISPINLSINLYFFFKFKTWRLPFIITEIKQSLLFIFWVWSSQNKGSVLSFYYSLYISRSEVLIKFSRRLYEVESTHTLCTALFFSTCMCRVREYKWFYSVKSNNEILSCVWYHQCWEKFPISWGSMRKFSTPSEPQRGQNLQFLSSLSYWKAGTAPQSHSQPRAAKGCPAQKSLDMSWLNKAFTLPCQGSSKGLVLSQLIWGFLQSHWRKAVPLAWHFRAGASLLWVTSWGCTSFPTNCTNHRWNLKICWSLTTWWAHSLSTCPLPPTSDSSTHRQVSGCQAQGEVGVTFRVTPWSVERDMFFLWVIHHRRWWGWLDMEVPGSYSRWFTVTFSQLTLGQQIPLIPLDSAWKMHNLWPLWPINSEKKGCAREGLQANRVLQRDGKTMAKWLVLLFRGESCPLWIHMMCRGPRRECIGRDQLRYRSLK